MKISPDIKLDFDDVLLMPQHSTLDSRNDVMLERTFSFYHSNRTWTGVPICCANMASVAGFDMATSLAKYKMITCLHKYLNIKDIVEYFAENPSLLPYVWVSIGYNSNNISKILDIADGIGEEPNICVDVANGHLDNFARYCDVLRNRFSHSIIMAGNVSISESVWELIIHGGVDICKTFTGPGSQCKTRLVSGIGVPSLSCVDDCSHTAHGLKSADRRLGLVCADGGFKNPGDICKGLAGGADFVMSGSLFAGAEECCGEWIYDTDFPQQHKYGILNVKKSLKYYGMSSHYAQEKHEGKQKTYRASEGNITEIPYKGPVSNIVQEILGGIRSCCTYIGANSIKDMSKCAQFIRVNRIK